MAGRTRSWRSGGLATPEFSAQFGNGQRYHKLRQMTRTLRTVREPRARKTTKCPRAAAQAKPIDQLSLISTAADDEDAESVIGGGAFPFGAPLGGAAAVTSLGPAGGSAADDELDDISGNVDRLEPCGCFLASRILAGFPMCVVGCVIIAGFAKAHVQAQIDEERHERHRAGQALRSPRRQLLSHTPWGATGSTIVLDRCGQTLPCSCLVARSARDPETERDKDRDEEKDREKNTQTRSRRHRDMYESSGQRCERAGFVRTSQRPVPGAMRLRTSNLESH